MIHPEDYDKTPYERLSKAMRTEMERLGKLQGVEEQEVEQQYNDAQVAIHGNPSPYPGHALTRGFKSRGARHAG